MFGMGDGQTESKHHKTPPSPCLLRRHLARLKSSPYETLLLDGGTGEELFLRGVPDDRKIWSATAIVHERYHAILEEVHRSFIRSGSQVVTTNSYGIVPGVGFNDGKEVIHLTSLAGEIARKSVFRGSGDIDKEEQQALVLGSLGPLVESYRPDLIMDHDEGVLHFAFPIEGLYKHVDMYIIETSSTTKEAFQAIDALAFFNRSPSRAPRPLLVSFTLKQNGKIRSDESVVDAIPAIIKYCDERDVEIVGVLFNCCEPEAIDKALVEIQRNKHIHGFLHHPPSAGNDEPEHDEKNSEHNTKVLLGAYANRLMPVQEDWTISGSTSPNHFRNDLSPERYWSDFVRRWCLCHGTGDEECLSSLQRRGGLQIVGGCCGITPGHINVLRNGLSKSNTEKR
mmetsp:Transcript_35224/g.84163  ORF Transcript_35224/g.84163 Transcript_35224/m.84163 type:complete len:396 (+) Transcript_35224:171-1358(+)